MHVLCPLTGVVAAYSDLLIKGPFLSLWVTCNLWSSHKLTHSGYLMENIGELECRESNSRLIFVSKSSYILVRHDRYFVFCLPLILLDCTRPKESNSSSCLGSTVFFVLVLRSIAGLSLLLASTRADATCILALYMEE